MEKEQLLSALAQALQEADLNRLEELAKEAVRLYPAESLGYEGLAFFFLQSDFVDYAKVETCLAKAIELKRDNAALYIQMAVVKEKQNLFEDAYLMYKKVEAIEPNNPQALIGQGLYQLRILNDDTLALNFFNRALENGASSVVINTFIAEAHYENDDLEKALDFIHKSLEEAVTADGLELKTLILRKAHRTEEAIACFEELVTLAPEEFIYTFDLAKLLFNTGDFVKSLEYFEKAKALNIDDSIDIFFHLPYAKALVANNAFDVAKPIVDKLLDIDDENFDLLQLAADIHKAAKDYDTALEYIKQIVQLTAEEKASIPYFYQVGEIYIAKGELAKAAGIFKKMTKDRIYNKLGFYGLGLYAQANNDEEKTYKFMKVAQNLGHDNAANFIQTNCTNYLGNKKTEILGSFTSAHQENAQSSTLSPIFGKLWQFESMSSKKMTGLAPELLQGISKELEAFSVILTDKGLVSFGQKQANIMTYSIKSQNDQEVALNCTPLDGFPGFELKLNLNEGQLSYSQEEGEYLYLSSDKTIGEANRSAIVKQAQAEDLAYLGTHAEKALSSIFN